MHEADKYRGVMELIEKGNRFLIGTHINPDGDGIGSMLALERTLSSLGKTAVMLVQDPLPDSLAFLPGSHRIVSQIPKGESFDAAIMVDCGEPKRAGKLFADAVRDLTVAVVDHHLYNELEGGVLCLDEHAASAGEVVWHLIGKLGVKKTSDMALCIYTTLVVDTGFFRYSNTTKDVLGIAAELVGLGANPWLVAKNLDESYPAQRLRLMGESIQSFAISADGRYGSMDVTQAMLKKTGAELGDSDEFAAYPRSIKSVEVAALFREVGDGNVKVSLRSKDYVNVAEIARRHDGGGHVHAAGFTAKGDLAEVKATVEREVQRALEG